MQSRLMPLAATIMVVVYASGVVGRHSTLWYEWLAAAAGVGFALWYWFDEWIHARKKAKKREPKE